MWHAQSLVVGGWYTKIPLQIITSISPAVHQWSQELFDIASMRRLITSLPILPFVKWSYKLFVLQSIIGLATQRTVFNCYVSIVRPQESMFHWRKWSIELCKELLHLHGYLCVMMINMWICEKSNISHIYSKRWCWVVCVCVCDWNVV